MTREIQLFVGGVPRPKGSPKIVTRARGGRPLASPIVLHDTPAAKEWQDAVAAAARECFRALSLRPLDVAVEASFHFFFPRRRSHLTSTGKLRATAPSHPGHRDGDIDKLLRSTLDGLERGGALADDTRIVWAVASKSYCDEAEPLPGALITLQKWVPIAAVGPMRVLER